MSRVEPTLSASENKKLAGLWRVQSWGPEASSKFAVKDMLRHRHMRGLLSVIQKAEDDEFSPLLHPSPPQSWRSPQHHHFDF